MDLGLLVELIMQQLLLRGAVTNAVRDLDARESFVAGLSQRPIHMSRRVEDGSGVHADRLGGALQLE